MSMPSWSKPIFLISCSVSIPRLNSRLVLNFSSSDFSILTGEERQGPGVLRILSQINGNFSSHFVNLKDGLSFQFKSFKWLSQYTVSAFICVCNRARPELNMAYGLACQDQHLVFLQIGCGSIKSSQIDFLTNLEATPS